MSSVLRVIAGSCLSLLMAASTLHCCAQNTADENSNPYAGLPLKDRLFVGGDLGLNLGTITFIRLAPIVGVNFSDEFSAGIGPSYQYFQDKRYTPDFQTSIYGGTIFGRYFFLENVFAHSQFELVNLERFAIDPTSTEVYSDRVNVPVWFVGGGYGERAGNTGFFVMVLYDLIQDIYSPYPSDIVVRVGVNFGL